MITGIVVALAEELSTLTTQKIDKGSCILANDHLLIAFSGAGADNAETAAELLINQGASRLISWGCAAGLSDLAKPGDLTLANCLVGADLSNKSIDAAWHQHSVGIIEKHSDIRIRNGKIVESRELVVSSREKKKLNLASGAVALDMESAAVARVADRHKLKFLVIRAIADPVGMDLPKAVAYALNDQGDVSLRKLLSYLTRHPAELPKLIKLGAHFHKAKRTLVKAADLLEFIIDFRD